MINSTRVVFGLILFLAPFFSHIQSIDQEATYLKRGLYEKNKGNHSRALEMWEEARIVLDKPSLAISIEHIQLTTEQKIQDSYQIASAMFFWGLEAVKVDSQTIALEMQRIEPLVDELEYRTWGKTFKKNPTAVLKLMHQFWRSIDPTPNTPYNERLIEHWERIAYARNNFNYNNNSIYGTDDRGIGWVQFGEPSSTREGVLTIDPGQVYNLTYQRLLLGVNPQFQPLADGLDPDPDAGSGISPPSVDSTDLGNNFLNATGNESIAIAAYAREIENDVFTASKPRKYEIWIYDKHDVGPEYNHILLFGDTDGKGFAKAETVDDFIPPSSFTLSKRNSLVTLTQGFPSIDYEITPGILLQHEYLSQLAGIDPQFGRALTNLKDDFFRIGAAPRKAQGFTYKRNHELVARQVEAAAPDETSTYKELFPSIPINVNSYRFLDDEGKPYSISYMGSFPQGAFILDSSHNADTMFANPLDSALNIFNYYSFTHGIQVRNKEWQVMDAQKVNPEIIIDPYITSPPSESVFRVPHIEGDATQVFYAELKNSHPSSLPKIESPFPKHLRGIGKLQLPQQEPLNTDPSVLEVSDLVFGNNIEKDAAGIQIPFTPLHNREIPLGDNIALHYEVYHLQAAQSGISRFEIEFEITEKYGLLEIFRQKNPNYSLILNQQSEQSYFRETLEIETENLEEGTYILRMAIIDAITKKSMEKKMEFKIVKR